MELTNFRIGGQYIDLEWGTDGYADLHNDFDFTNLQYAPANARLLLEWTKSSGKWANKVPYQSLRLVFEGVYFFKVKARDPEYPLSEDKTLAQISRNPPEACDEFQSMYFNEDAQSHYDLTIGFQSEWGIKANAATVRLELES
ncbi:hypothetical protein CDA63_13650 [Hymenobacter amundsenii]|uniref:Uncharacterized protein n=1 Tax=Hymenobacter amundsenii TaxID=2006685 RepID=A0A246FJ35_9BACT|nr:hypothetical protein [Hymenobacter amundsenii]OWP62548.1 hypothetical protein CDA63_13650 [Hymenobacter amundsenii]